jgi:hypothetical protein
MVVAVSTGPTGNPRRRCCSRVGPEDRVHHSFDIPS